MSDQIGKDFKEIGRGFYGVSYLDENSKKVYKKILPYNRIEFEAEITNLMDLKNHNHILSVEQRKDPHDEHSNFKYLFMDYSECGSLYKALHLDLESEKKKKKFSGILALNYLKQCIMALQALHDKHIVHGNLTSRNVLLFKNYKVLKICLDPVKSNGISISAYTPPEIFSYKPATAMSDVYSFGILLWELLSRKKPFNFNENTQILQLMVLSGERPSLDDMNPELHYIDIMKDVAKQCWNEDPNKRPTVNILNTLFSYDVDLIAFKNKKNKSNECP